MSLCQNKIRTICKKTAISLTRKKIRQKNHHTHAQVGKPIVLPGASRAGEDSHKRMKRVRRYRFHGLTRATPCNFRDQKLRAIRHRPPIRRSQGRPERHIDVVPCLQFSRHRAEDGDWTEKEYAFRVIILAFFNYLFFGRQRTSFERPSHVPIRILRCLSSNER